PVARARSRRQWVAAAFAALLAALALYAACLHYRARALDQQWRALAAQISPAAADRVSLLSLANLPGGTLSEARGAVDAIASLAGRSAGTEDRDRMDAALAEAIAAAPNSA